MAGENFPSGEPSSEEYVPPTEVTSENFGPEVSKGAEEKEPASTGREENRNTVWDETHKENEWLEGQRSKYEKEGNQEVLDKIAKYLKQNNELLQRLLDDIDHEAAGKTTPAATEKTNNPLSAADFDKTSEPEQKQVEEGA